MLEKFLKRIAYIDPRLTRGITFDHERANYVKQPYGSGNQMHRNQYREGTRGMVMVEQEVDKHGNVTSEKPFVVSGVGINLTGNNKLDYQTYITNGSLKEQLICSHLKQIYINMMSAAAAHGAKGFVCPLLSSGYYAGKEPQQKKNMKRISEEAFQQAKSEFSQISKAILETVLETTDSVGRAQQMARSLGCYLSEIAIGIAGADNSGTGNLKEAQEKLRIGDPVPQEEGVRLALDGAFADPNCYQLIDEVVDQTEVLTKNSKDVRGFFAPLALSNMQFSNDRTTQSGKPCFEISCKDRESFDILKTKLGNANIEVYESYLYKSIYRIKCAKDSRILYAFQSPTSALEKQRHPPEKKGSSRANRQPREECKVSPDVLKSAKDKLLLLVEQISKLQTNKKTRKGELLKQLKEELKACNTQIDFNKVAKRVIMLSLQRRLFGFTNTTDSGLLIKKFMNQENNVPLKKLLFPNKTNGKIRYRDLRIFVLGGNKEKFFSSRYKQELYDVINKDKTKELEELIERRGPPKSK